jgi:hypothetical protein
MPDLESKVKLETRFAAIEYVTVYLSKLVFTMARFTPEEIAAWMKTTREHFEKDTFPTLDPASSDLAAAEQRDAVLRLLAAIAESMGVALPEDDQTS